jgi:invasion protein IalB
MRYRGLALALLLPAGMACAQAPTAPAPASGPDRTSAAHGDWMLRCEVARPPGQASVRTCEVALTFSDQRGQAVAQLVMGRTRRTEPLRMVLQVPLEIRTDQPARIIADPAAPAGQAVELPFRMCSAARGGCFAEAELIGDIALQRLLARGENPGRVTFRDSAGREIQLPLSLRGFAQALEALAREQG